MYDEKETFTSKEQLAVLMRLLKYLKPYKLLVFIAFIIILIATITNLLGPIIIKNIVDTAFVSGDVKFDIVYQSITLYALITTVSAIFRYFQTYQFNNIGFRIARDLRVELYAKLQNLGMRYFDQTPAGSIVSRVTNDTEAIQEMLNNVLSVIVSSIILISGIIIAMLLLNVTMAIICIAFLPIAIFIVYLYQKYSTKFYLIAREKLSQLNTRLSESISGMDIIQIFNQQKRFANEFEETNTEYYDASMKTIRLNGLLLASAIHLLTGFCLAFIFAYAGFQSLHAAISVGVVVAFIEYVYRYFEPLFQIMDRLAIYQQAIVAAHRIFKIIDHNELTPQQNQDADSVITEGKIEFKNLSFSYDGKNEVLSNISFVANPGESIALVGHTGSGKSSIINVIMRFYEFYEGEVLIDGKSIKDYPIQQLRDKMGLVLQDPFLFYGSINDNVRLKNSSISDRQIQEACEFVQANTFIDQLSDTYKHQVIERGAAFSTGQKQLLAFARTIVTDPKILILDEATANIDTETENLIQEGLDKIRKGRTSIAIAHRLSTIKDANMILVLDKGKIVERGTHSELIKQKGIYYAMYQLQKSEEQFA